MKYRLFAADELQPGEMRQAQIENASIVVLRSHDGSVHALRGVCPHRGADLIHGWVQRTVHGEDVGEYGVRNDEVLRCPWHGFEFDVSTGRCVADPKRYGVRTYKVTVEDGTIVVER